MIFSFIPLVGIIAWPIGITGLILGFVGLARFNRREATNRGVCIGGLITSRRRPDDLRAVAVGIGIAGSADRHVAATHHCGRRSGSSSPPRPPGQACRSGYELRRRHL